MTIGSSILEMAVIDTFLGTPKTTTLLQSSLANLSESRLAITRLKPLAPGIVLSFVFGRHLGYWTGVVLNSGPGQWWAGKMLGAGAGVHHPSGYPVQGGHQSPCQCMAARMVGPSRAALGAPSERVPEFGQRACPRRAPCLQDHAVCLMGYECVG